MAHIGCKHLDYINIKDGFCKLITTPEGWRWWEVQSVQSVQDAPTKVQYCKLKGRINGIFQCINKGEKSCYEGD